MPDWLIVVIVVLLAAGCAGGCRRAWGRLRASGDRGSLPREAGGGAGAGRDVRGEGGTGGEARGETRGETDRGQGAGEPREETPLEALQRRFVEGEMTLEEYERAIDRLDSLE